MSLVETPGAAEAVEVEVTVCGRQMRMVVPVLLLT